MQPSDKVSVGSSLRGLCRSGRTPEYSKLHAMGTLSSLPTYSQVPATLRPERVPWNQSSDGSCLSTAGYASARYSKPRTVCWASPLLTGTDNVPHVTVRKLRPLTRLNDPLQQTQRASLRIRKRSLSFSASPVRTFSSIARVQGKRIDRS